MSAYNRFDHEQQIMQCWQVTDDLNTVLEGLLEQDISRDQAANCLQGLREIYQLRFEKLWNTFEASLKHGRV